MAETKDKVVTVESLSALHEHGKNTYMTIDNPSAKGEMTMNGDATFSGSISLGSNIKLVPTSEGLNIVFLNEETIGEES